MTAEEKRKRIKTLENNFYKKIKKQLEYVENGYTTDYQEFYKEIKIAFRNFDSQRRKIYDEVVNDG